jgi:hypothetical protein
MTIATDKKSSGKEYAERIAPALAGVSRLHGSHGRGADREERRRRIWTCQSGAVLLGGHQALYVPFAFAVCVAIASMSGGDKQS